MADYIRHNCQLNRQNVSLRREKCVYIFYKDIYIPIPCTNMTRDLEYMKGNLFEKLNGKALTNSICVNGHPSLRIVKGYLSTDGRMFKYIVTQISS